MPEFGQLHEHDEFSLLDGVGTPLQHAQCVADLGQGFLAQTNHGTLAGSLHHIAACRKVGIVPIVGVEAYYRPVRNPKFKTRQAWHLILLAKNMRGWHNLLRLVSTAYADPAEGGGFYQHPCVDDELLDRHNEGIICMSACFQSWLANLIRAGDHVAVRDYVRKMKNRYGSDFYLEIMPHDFDDQRMLNIEIARIAIEESIMLTATNDSHFVLPEHSETQRISKMMGTNLSFSKVEKMTEKGEEPPYLAELFPTGYLCTRQDMIEWFAKHHPDLDKWAWNSAITNTATLAHTFKPFMLDRSIKMPKVAKTDDEAEQILSRWIDEGRARILNEYPSHHWNEYPESIYNDRVDFEWKVLKEKGAIPYMVMVGDIIRFCHERKIRVGVRGSAAGCLISYLVGISALDPIPWGLLFERFLNPGRKGLPDIDIDVQTNRRKEVKKFVIEKYGADHVADIITHERYQPKSVLQRLCRVYDVPYLEAQAVTDTIDIRPDDEETKLEELLPINEKLREFKSKYPHIWEHAIILEGTVSNYGKHAAGVVITPEPIIEYMALERGKKGDLVTAFADSADFLAISDNGFIKIDLLGLKGLERHDYALKLIKDRTGKEINLDKLSAARDPRDADPEALQLFTDGYTTGLFQFGGKGITNLIRSIKPDTVLDLTAANALYRPGPMGGGVTWDYARIKRGDKDPPKWSKIPLVAKTMAETHGLIAYQEQVMVIAQKMGGFSPAQADDLRKAMGKLYRIQGSAAREFMQGYHDLWVEGCKKNGVDDETRDMVWEYELGFGSYGFNKSHSGWYGFRAYQDAWLKKYYPLEFFASILTFPSGSSPKAKQEFISRAVREARSLGVKFLPPDINKSDLHWTADGDAVRVGLMAIKDVGEVAAAKIILERPGANPFTRIDGYSSIDKVRELCGGRAVNKKVVTALTEAGAFDCFGARDEASASQIAVWEKDRLKITISGVSESDKYAYLIQPNIYTQDEVERAEKGAEVIIGGEIVNIERKTAKNGNDFANVSVVFQMNEWRVRFWQKQLSMFEEFLTEGSVVMINGRKDEWQGYISVIASDVCDMQEMLDTAEKIEEGIPV